MTADSNREGVSRWLLRAEIWRARRRSRRDGAFPSDFLWGSATSSYQIEGAVSADGRGESIWDRFCATPGAIKDGTNGDVACDHYHRYPDDIALMRRLNLNAYRFSIAWPRVLPNGTGTVNQAGLDFYDRLVDALLAAGIQPFPTLYHWDLPQVLEDDGGWPVRATAEAFADYAEIVVGRLGDRVSDWMTLNEPFVSANHGYLTGEHAPGRRSLADGLAASHHLLVGHGLAMERIRAALAGAKVGIVLNFTPVTPIGTSPAARRSATTRRRPRQPLVRRPHWRARLPAVHGRSPLLGTGRSATTATWR